MCACVHAGMHGYMYTRIRIGMHACMHDMYTCIRIGMHACMHACMKCTHVYTCIRIGTCMHACVSACMYVQACIIKILYYWADIRRQYKQK